MPTHDPWEDQGRPPEAPPDPWQDGFPATPRRRFRHRRALLLVFGGVLAFILLSELFNFVQRSINPQERLVREAMEQGVEKLPELIPQAQDSQQARANAAADRPTDIPGFIESLLASVVAVKCNLSADQWSYGSGFGFDAGSLNSTAGNVVVTNWHVLEDCPQSSPILVSTQQGTEVGARLIAMDPNADLAILAPAGLDLPALQPAADFSQGDWVMAAGNPEGVTGTTTSGTIATVKPDIEEIYSDALIAPGSSGGPLVNNRGEVIGVTSMTFTESTGFSVSRPITTLCNVILDCT